MDEKGEEERAGKLKGEGLSFSLFLAHEQACHCPVMAVPGADCRMLNLRAQKKLRCLTPTSRGPWFCPPLRKRPPR